MTSSSSSEGRREATWMGNSTRREGSSESSSRSLRSEGKTKGGAMDREIERKARGRKRRERGIWGRLTSVWVLEKFQGEWGGEGKRSVV